jgi:hypothetical protein
MRKNCIGCLFVQITHVKPQHRHALAMIIAKDSSVFPAYEGLVIDRINAFLINPD